MEAIAKRFDFAGRGTTLGVEVRGGVTTFLVMAYIIFLNGNIIAKPLGLDPVAVAAGTALIAGIMTIAMGWFANFPFALAAGLGINAIVAFTLTGKGLDAAGAMGVIVLEGVAVTVLVIIGAREAIMNAVPLSLKRAIGVGIGFFILFIGFANGGLITSGCAPDSAQLGFCDGTLVTFAFPATIGQYVFIAGLVITFVLYALKVKAALIISIIATTVIAILTGVQSVDVSHLVVTPNLSTLGLGLQNPFEVFTKLGFIAAVLTVFAIMLTDFFDTMGTATGVAAEAGLAAPDGSVPGIGRVLLIDSLAAVAGGAGGVSSNTTYIESAAGVAEGARTGFASVVTGILFLLAIFLSPIAGLVPSQATAPALVLVGFLMFTLIKDIKVDLEDGLPALLTMLLMPLTYDITVGIGAGFITWVLLKVVLGKWREVHPLMWVVTIGFLIYFGQATINSLIH